MRTLAVSTALLVALALPGLAGGTQGGASEGPPEIRFEPERPGAGARVEAWLTQDAGSVTLSELSPGTPVGAAGPGDANGTLAGEGAHFVSARLGWSTLFVPSDVAGEVSATHASGARAPIAALPATAEGWREVAVVFTAPGAWRVETGGSTLTLDIPNATDDFPIHEADSSVGHLLLARGDREVLTVEGGKLRMGVFVRERDAWKPFQDVALRATATCRLACGSAASSSVPLQATSSPGVLEARVPFALPGRWELLVNATLPDGSDEGVAWLVDVLEPALSDESASDAGSGSSIRFTALRKATLVAHARSPTGGFEVKRIVVGDALPYAIDIVLPGRTALGSEVLLQAVVSPLEAGTPSPSAVTFHVRDAADAERDLVALPFGEGVWRARYAPAIPGDHLVTVSSPSSGVPEGSVAREAFTVFDPAAPATPTAPATPPDSPGDSGEDDAPPPAATPLPGLLAAAAFMGAARVARRKP